jgi:DNA repair exonuclease SbcCD nuclease subunit
MRIGFIGDVHLGASLSLSSKDISVGMPSRQEDYFVTLKFTIKSLFDNGARYLVFTGDIFEHRLPTIKQQECFSNALSFALELGFKQILICVGNHDQLRTINSTNLSYLKELRLPQIKVCDEIECIQIEEDGKVLCNLISIPYRDKRWYSVATNAEALDALDNEFSLAVSSIDNDAPKVVVGHMTVEGTLWMVEEYADLYNGNELVLPQAMFNDINVTVMGHVHTPGVISKKPLIFYTGSMEKRGGFEDHDKKYFIVDLASRKLIDFIEPCRNIYDISISFVEKPMGKALLIELKKAIDQFCAGKSLKDSIIKFNLRLQASDEKYCDSDELANYMIERYEVSHCIEAKPSLVFNRQARDENITERTSEEDAYRRYIENEYALHPLKIDILENGLEFFGLEVEG